MPKLPYGLYIHGHGSTNYKTLCFLPPLFTNAVLLGSYGNSLYSTTCEYSKEPMLGTINNIDLGIMGQAISTTHEFPDKYSARRLEFNINGIGIHNKDNKIKNYWENRHNKTHNLFTPLINMYSLHNNNLNYDKPKTYYDRVLHLLSLIQLYKIFFGEFDNSMQSDIYMHVFVPHKIFTYDNVIINDDIINNLIGELHVSNYKILKSEILAKLELIKGVDEFHDEWFVEPMGIKLNTTLNTNKYINNFVNVLTEKEIKEIYIMANVIKYITTLTNIFYTLFHIPLLNTKLNNLDNLYNLLDPNFLSEYSNILLLYTYTFVEIDKNVSENLDFIEYLNKNQYNTSIADTLNELKSNLVTSRLTSTNKDSDKFILHSASCRGITDIESRKFVYSELENVFSESPHIPKSVTKYAIDNTKPDNEMGTFKGRLPPHVIVNTVLFPCFLYLAMDSKTLTRCGILTSHRILFNELISTLQTFKIQKATLMAFFDKVTPSLVDNMILAVIKAHTSFSAYSVYTNIINYVIYTLCIPNKQIDTPYHVEDFLLIFGVIINNLLVFIDLNNAKYRDLLSIQPKEYPFHGNMQHNEDYIPSKPSIWNNLPENNTISMARHNGPTNPSPKLSKKQRKLAKRLNQRNKTFKQLGRVYKHTDIITKQTILDITYRILTHNKYPYLTELVEQDPQTYIYRLLQLSEQYKM